MSQSIRLTDAAAPLWRWIDARLNDAAAGFVAWGQRLRPRRRALFVEQADGSFAGPSGVCRIEDEACVFTGAPATLRRGEVEFRLAPERCTFREIELPAGAAPFLDGVVRAQIDRLIPWRASEAAFGWSAAQAAGADRIAVTVAATPRRSVAALLRMGADAIAVTTERDGVPIVILSQRAGDVARLARSRAAVTTLLLASLVAGLAAVAADLTLGAQARDEIDARTAELSKLRAALARREREQDDPVTQALDARKRATPATVVALEALSRTLPDAAYLTQLRFAGDKVELAGVAADAAGLIRLIEQSPHFSRAAFSAPTTRAADERQSFRIEAHVAPLNQVTP